MKRLIVFSLGLALALPLITPAEASADVLCRAGSKLKIRNTKCKAKKGEELVLPEDIGLEGEQGPRVNRASTAKTGRPGPGHR